MSDTAENNPSPVASPTPPKRSRLKRFLITVGILLVICTGALAVAEYRTSQPDFCASCHIMEPYYQSWEADVHGGKLQIACVECHYAPGERTTINAKLRGLSQVTSYFSGRYGAGRPRAHVSNLSCLTAKCHGDLKFMDKPLTLAGVKFLHSNHLNRDEAKNKPAQERLAKLTEELKTSLGAEHFSELEAVAKESGHAADRHAKMSQLVKQWTVPVETEVLAEFTTLQHRQVRISQLNDLQCTNCHAYSSPKSGVADNRAEHHFHVSTTTCFTCHFNNEAFNTGTSECLSCHSPPQQEITVHAEVRGEGGEKLGAKLVKMNHAEILAKKVDCVACHADAIRDDATVSRRDCERCHDQPRFFEDYAEPFSLDLVNRYHEVHIERQKAKCVDCHSEIQHRLIPDNGEQSNADFLTSSLANCAQCHPNHHAAQVNLLMGRGGLTVPKSEPNLMFGSRTNCSGCHTQHGKDPHGNSVTKATEAACFACHGDRHKDTFEKWKLGLELVMEDAVAACAAARKKIEETTDAKPEALAQAKKLLEEAEADLQLVRTGNGLHNITYAMELLDAVTTRANQASAALQSTE